MSETQVVNPVQEEPQHMELRTEGLVKRYGKRTVVNGVSFNVRQGEIVGLLGPNGAGKTTSFYMTTGLIVPNEGHVFINDKEITTYPVYKRARRHWLPAARGQRVSQNERGRQHHVGA